MNRDTFMKELKYLLQDISEEEKADALAYYADYLDEAGPEEEERVLREFGSPERIAAIIRADLEGNLEDGGGFTDRGYEDERFREPNYSVAPRKDLPEKPEDGGQAEEPKETAQGGETPPSRNSQESAGKGGHPRKQSNGWKIAGIILLVAITSPLWLALFGVAIGILGGGAGILIGILAVAAVLLLLLAVWTAGWILAGLLGTIVGFIIIFTPGNLVNGIWCIGIGIAFLGIGIVSLAACALLYGKCLPWLFRSIIDGISRLIHRRERRQKQ